MTLSALIRKRSTVPVATAIRAIRAISEGVIVGTVARIATIAVANPTEGKAANRPEPENDHEPDTRHYRWLIHFPERDPVHTCCLPEPTHAEVLAMHPDAIAAEPMPERYAAMATQEQEAELKALVAAELGNDLEHDDRRHCDQCMNLRRDICTIAEPKAGALVVANRGYRPVREPPRRCKGYAPGPDDPDRRTGAERWPFLTATP